MVEVTGELGRALPMADAPRTRADAVRNRELVLAAARAIVARSGVAGLSMDAVAREAEVGVGTVYRRFGDLAGLAQALLHDREIEFQTSFLSGPPPLGPGAAPSERIRAFLTEVVGRMEDETDLAVLAATSKTAFSPSYVARHTHLAALIAEAAPDLDAIYLADCLLAPLAPGLYRQQRETRGMGPERIRTAFGEFLGLLDLGR